MEENMEKKRMGDERRRRMSLNVCLCLPPPWVGVSGGADEAARAAARPLGGPSSWRVCGRHRQPILPSEHRHHRHRQHRTERWQGAGPQGLRHGLHPDRCYNQCENATMQKTVLHSIDCLAVQ